jgi:hypothetical protein
MSAAKSDMANSFKVQFVTRATLCQLFNDGRYFERAEAGEFRQVVRRNGHPTPPAADEPDCTRSQIISYYDGNGNRVANVHRYLRPDGTVGLSGKADPKCLLQNGVLYKIGHPPVEGQQAVAGPEPDSPPTLTPCGQADTNHPICAGPDPPARPSA